MLDDYRELIDLLAHAPQQLQAAAEQAGDPAGEVCGHLAASERLYLGWLNDLLQRADPLLRAPNATHLAEQERLQQQPAADNLAAFNNSRGDTISLLMGLSLRDWERAGILEEEGREVTLAELVEELVDRDAGHLAQLRGLAG
ncbi:MAG TPA: DinB family protein [Thermomicrobiales bacterium]|nr:DinB family protein [Thermomicrobiales bacterium]